MEFDLCMRLGVTVVEVPDLDVTVAYVPRHHVALVKAGLAAGERLSAADWVLEEATKESWIPRPTS